MCLHRDQSIVGKKHVSVLPVMHIDPTPYAKKHDMNTIQTISESGISDILCMIATAMLNATGVWTDMVVEEKS